MRILAPAVLLLVAGCGQGDRGTNRSSVGSRPSRTADTPAPAPTIIIAATGPGGCSASWDGRVVTPEQIASRGFGLVRQAVEAAGGAQNINPDTLPVFNVEAPADLGIACADPILSAIQSSSMASVNLRAAGQAPVLMDFPFDTGAPPPPIPTVLGIGAGGEVTWNSDPVDAAGLAAQLIRVGGSTAAPDPAEGEPPPGGLELRVQREATFGQLYALLQTTRRYHLRPVVYLPSAGPGPSPVANPAPPMPPMPPMPPGR